MLINWKSWVSLNNPLRIVLTVFQIAIHIIKVIDITQQQDAYNNPTKGKQSCFIDLRNLCKSDHL